MPTHTYHSLVTRLMNYYSAKTNIILPQISNFLIKLYKANSLQKLYHVARNEIIYFMLKGNTKAHYAAST